jgi:hypothetical protein
MVLFGSALELFDLISKVFSRMLLWISDQVGLLCLRATACSSDFFPFLVYRQLLHFCAWFRWPATYSASFCSDGLQPFPWKNQFLFALSGAVPESACNLLGRINILFALSGAKSQVTGASY